MNDIANDRTGPMMNPPHLGELIRESMDDVGWNVTETAERLGCERGTLSRLLNGKAAYPRTWRWCWRISVGAPPITGCGCRRATSLRRRARAGPPPNGARAHCTYDAASRSHRRMGTVPSAAVHLRTPLPATQPLSKRPLTIVKEEIWTYEKYFTRVSKAFWRGHMLARRRGQGPGCLPEFAAAVVYTRRAAPLRHSPPSPSNSCSLIATASASRIREHRSSAPSSMENRTSGAPGPPRGAFSLTIWENLHRRIGQPGPAPSTDV